MTTPEDLTDLSEGYRGAFDGGLTPGARPAVVVVDVVRAYLEPGSPLFMASAAAARDATAALVAAARASDVEVVWTNVRYEPGGRDGGRFFEKVPALELFVGDAPLGDFDPAASPVDGERVITKQYPSAFFGTDLAAYLQARGVDTVLLCGFSTSGCVRASALDALCHGFVPLVVADGCADRDPRPHDANLFDLAHKYAEVVELATATAYLGDLDT